MFAVSETTKLRQTIVVLLGDKLQLNSDIADLNEDILKAQRKVG